MDINLQVFVGGEKNVLRLKGVPENVANPIVRDFFRSIRKDEPVEGERNLTIEPLVNPSEDNPVIGIPVIGATEKIRESIDKAVDKHLEVSRKLPVLGQENRSSFPVAEAAVLKPGEEPEHWKTGIKVDDDGEKRYKCRYICTECGAKSNVYIYLDEEYVTCYECKTDMFVEPATKTKSGEIPNRDSFGNYFVAGGMTS